jgi:P pilus assembly chaperone PapD
LLSGFALLAFASAASAELVLSQLVVDLAPATPQRADIEVWNNSDERAYVAAEPSEIIAAGMPNEERRAEADPEKRGLLVSPNKMILEPGQRRLIRLAAIGPRAARERVYRVTVKPVAGELAAEESGLKLLVGYDVLVLLRPNELRPKLSAVRIGKRLTLRNEGNASVELIGGKQCGTSGQCTELPGKRLYSGAEWSQELNSDAPVEYAILSGGRSVRQTF